MLHRQCKDKLVLYRNENLTGNLEVAMTAVQLATVPLNSYQNCGHSIRSCPSLRPAVCAVRTAALCVCVCVCACMRHRHLLWHINLGQLNFVKLRLDGHV